MLCTQILKSQFSVRASLKVSFTSGHSGHLIQQLEPFKHVLSIYVAPGYGSFISGENYFHFEHKSSVTLRNIYTAPEQQTSLNVFFPNVSLDISIQRSKVHLRSSTEQTEVRFSMLNTKIRGPLLSVLEKKYTNKGSYQVLAQNPF